MASGIFSSIQTLSTKLLHAIRGTPSTSHHQDPVESVREDLEKLSRMLARIQAVQQDAEEREIHDSSVRLWLAELRGVAYQAEDVLDEFYYEVLRSIIDTGDAAIEAYHRDGGTKRKFVEMYTTTPLASYSFTITKASIPDGMYEQIKDITERFEEISNERRDLHLREEDGTRLVRDPQICLQTSSHMDERAIFGRKEETVMLNLRISYCPLLQFPLKNLLQSMTQRAEIYDCPRMDLGEGYVYQRDAAIEELNLCGNNEIYLSRASVNSTIPLLENPFTLFLINEDFQQVESLTPSVGVNFPCIMLNLASLVILEILRCRKVISVTGLNNLSNLKRFSISYCPEICNWKDKTLPLSLKFLELDSCDKLSSLPNFSVQNHSSTLKVLVIKKCPRLTVLEGFQCLMKLKTVELLHCRNICISPATENFQFRPHITIGDCPLMRDWCQRNNITYYELNPIDNPQDDREAELESAGSTSQSKSAETNLGLVVANFDSVNRAT